jgi:hypothetical protein
VLRLTGVLACVAAIVWCCLLFGIGLDDLTNDHTRPGVIVSVVLLPLLVCVLLYGGKRLIRPRQSSRRNEGR